MSNDQRENFRFTLQPEQRCAKLKAGGKKFSAEIIDQSATGFRVEVSSDANVALDDVVTLIAWSGTCQAVVAFVEDVNKMRRLGLKRISDDVPSTMNLLRGFWPKWQPSAPAKKRGSAKARYVAAGCLGLAALLAGGLAFCWRADPGDLASARSFAKDEAEDESHLEATVADDSNYGDKTRLTSAQAAGRSRIASKPMVIFQRLLSLHTAETVAGLELSEQQKLDVSRLLDEVSVGLSRIQSRRTLSTASRKEKIRTLFDRAEARAQKILTVRQWTKWQADASAGQLAEDQAMASAATEK